MAADATPSAEDLQAWVRAERLGLADLLEGLDDQAWRADSLCPGWTVRDGPPT